MGLSILLEGTTRGVDRPEGDAGQRVPKRTLVRTSYPTKVSDVSVHRTSYSLVRTGTPGFLSRHIHIKRTGLEQTLTLFVRHSCMSWKLIPHSIIIICTPLSLLLFCLWTIFALTALFGGDFQRTLIEGYEAVFVTQNPQLAIYIARHLIGTFGGLIGWLSLVALAVVVQRSRSPIPTIIKTGCFIGVLSAISIPAATGIFLPPVLLCASLLWLAAKRST